jgi:hypothetical protein
MYVRQSAPIAVESLRISLEGAAQAVGARLPAVDVVLSGTFSSPEPVPHVRGFGPAANTGVVLVGEKAGAHVATITLVLNGTRDEQREVLDALVHLPSSAPLLLVDWSRGHIVPLGDTNAIVHYLDA